MSLITRMRKQKAIWWQRSAGTDRYGKFSYSDPVEIDCRWEDAIGEMLSPTTEKHMAMTTVYVDRDMSVGDRLQLGEMESDTPANPLDSATSYEVERFEKLPNLKNTEYLRTAYLQWQSSTRSQASIRS